MNGASQFFCFIAQMNITDPTTNLMIWKRNRSLLGIIN